MFIRNWHDKWSYFIFQRQIYLKWSQCPIGWSRFSQAPSATSSSSTMVLALLAMFELYEVAEGVREHLEYWILLSSLQIKLNGRTISVKCTDLVSNLSLGHVICLFIGFFGCWVVWAYQIWVLSHQMTFKWPLNDLKWPIMTWKLNFLIKSHFGACNMSFHRLSKEKQTKVNFWT